VRTTSYWKFGGGYSYRTPRSKKTGWAKLLKDVPASAKKATPATKKKPEKSSPKTTKPRRKKPVAKKKTKKRSGFRLPGGIGPKAVLQTLGSGLALRALGMGGGGVLSGAGIIMTAAEYLSPFLGGMIGGAPAGNAGGYDY